MYSCYLNTHSLNNSNVCGGLFTSYIEWRVVLGTNGNADESVVGNARSGHRFLVLLEFMHVDRVWILLEHHHIQLISQIKYTELSFRHMSIRRT